jgi:hypothetical protein
VNDPQITQISQISFWEPVEQSGERNRGVPATTCVYHSDIQSLERNL